MSYQCELKALEFVIKWVARARARTMAYKSTSPISTKVTIRIWKEKQNVRRRTYARFGSVNLFSDRFFFFFFRRRLWLLPVCLNYLFIYCFFLFPFGSFRSQVFQVHFTRITVVSHFATCAQRTISHATLSTFTNSNIRYKMCVRSCWAWMFAAM